MDKMNNWISVKDRLPEDRRQKISEGCKNIEMAKKFNVSTGLICSIKKRRSWKHI